MASPRARPERDPSFPFIHLVFCLRRGSGRISGKANSTSTSPQIPCLRRVPFEATKRNQSAVSGAGGLFAAKIAPLTINIERQKQASPAVPHHPRNNRSPAPRVELDSPRFNVQHHHCTEKLAALVVDGFAALLRFIPRANGCGVVGFSAPFRLAPLPGGCLRVRRARVYVPVTGVIRRKTGSAPSGAVLFGPFSWAYKKKDEEQRRTG